MACPEKSEEKMKREVDYKKAWEKLEEWMNKLPRGYLWSIDISNKMDEILKQCTKKAEVK